MKRLSFLVVIILVISLIAGCSTKGNTSKESTNLLSSDELSKEERGILDTVDFNGDIEIYNYEVDETFNSMSIWLEVYEKGALISEQNRMTSKMSSNKGGISLVVNKKPQYQWKISNSNTGRSSSYLFKTDGNFESSEVYSVSSGKLNEPVEIVSDGEIVLKTYLFSDSDTVTIYGNQYYVDYPEFLNEYDYVYLLKCQFSTKTTDESHLYE